MQLIVFTKKNKYFGIKTENVSEIISATKCYLVPEAPEWVEGLINLRGSIVTLVNFSKFLNEEDTEQHDNIIIIQKDSEKIGLLVEGIVGVVDIDPETVQKLHTISDEPSIFLGLVPVEDKMTNIIDIMTIFAENEGSN